MTDAPKEIWALPNRMWAETAPPQSIERTAATRYIRADVVEELVEALEIIAGERQCIDNLMGNQDVAIAALAKHKEDES
jgi:hypothetical protein